MEEGNVTNTDEPILLESRDARGVVTLTLNRPAAFNALSVALIDALHAACQRLALDADLREMQASPTQTHYQALFDRCGAMMLALHRLPVPVIARVHGLATAAGCQLVALCDLAVAADSASFATSGINVGLFCATPSVPLSRNLPRKKAFELLVTGDFIDARTALAQGLVNRVVPAQALDAEVAALVASIVAKPRIALEMGKALFYRQLETGLEAALHDAARTMACNMADATAQEGVQAFIEKRAPSWRP